MERLTDRKTANDLKANAESLRELGFGPSILDKRYIKLAEYEDIEELFEKVQRPPVKWQTAIMKKFLETR